MGFNLFKKKTVVGVSITPEIGLEVAQVDFGSKSILKYAAKKLDYDHLKKNIADLDLFKDTLEDLLLELEIPKGSEIVLNIPTILLGISDYPAATDDNMVNMNIEDEASKLPVFQNQELCVDTVVLPLSTIQNKKVAYTVAQRITLIEIALQIKSLGYSLIGIDTTINSILNSLIYNDRVDTDLRSDWVLLTVDSNTCRVIPMLGTSYVDCFEEKIAIGEVLGDAENYETVVSAIAPILKNLPSKMLYVISSTNVIEAGTLASKLSYNGQIIHHNDNMYSDAPYLNVLNPIISDQAAKSISLGVIGAAINRDFAKYTSAPFNLFNDYLGEVYANEQPLEFKGFLLTPENMLVASGVFAVIAIVIVLLVRIPLKTIINKNNDEIKKLDTQIAKIDAYLKENESISTNTFDEGDEIRIGLQHNKNIYSYYTIVGTEIPQKLWLTHLQLGKQVTIEGQADNLESIYSFFRNVKDYNPTSEIKLQKLGLANKAKLTEIVEEDKSLEKDSLITSLNADFYEFRISDAPEVVVEKNSEKSDAEGAEEEDSSKNSKGSKKSKNKVPQELPEIKDLNN